LRILFIHTQYLQRGGEDRAVENEVQLLKSKGHDVEVLLFSNEEKGGFFQKLQAGLQTVYNRKAYRITDEKVKEFKPDIAHVHNLFYQASPSVLFALNKLNIPVVATLHNYRLICSNALLLRNSKPCELCVRQKFPIHGIKYRCYKSSAAASLATTSYASIHKLLNTWNSKVDTFIVLTDFANKIIKASSLNLEENKIEVKPNFSTDYYSDKIRRENYFLFAGRLSEEKGIRLLIQAFQQMPEQDLVIAGEGPLMNEVIQLCNGYANITYIGNLHHHKLIEQMQKAKALIFPSVWYEGLPFTIIEAFATGTPVLASKLGSMADLVKHEYNGMHFTSGRVDSIIQSVRDFCNSIHKNEFYLNARKTYLEQYTPDAGYHAIMNCYNKVLCRKTKK
jgi:glycosyltransferase involved in cell wall biosynthesis